jgi:hypothetical protein
VSTDASLFPIHFFNSEIFCEKCAQIRKFKVFSQEKYDKHYSKSEIPPNKPLFCKCEKCSSTVIYATNEFAELQEDPTLGLCKIWGNGNLEAGDLVFHPTENLCMVESVNRISSTSQITLKKQNKEKIEIQLESLPTYEQNADVFYRLFPQDAINARLGDHIYHTETKRVGVVAGLEFSDKQTVVIKFENGELAKCRCEKNSHYLTDKILELNAKWRCRDLPYSQNLQINSHSKILHVNCWIPNFDAVCELSKIIFSIPQVRCFIMHVILEKANISSNDIYKELIRKCVYLCNCNVELKSQETYITGFYSARGTPKNIYRALQKLSIKKINLDIRMRPDIKTIKTINESDCFIKISKMGKEVHIDGWVRNEKEKKRAKWMAFFCSFCFRIENHLLVIN